MASRRRSTASPPRAPSRQARAAGEGRWTGSGSWWPPSLVVRWFDAAIGAFGFRQSPRFVRVGGADSAKRPVRRQPACDEPCRIRDESLPDVDRPCGPRRSAVDLAVSGGPPRGWRTIGAGCPRGPRFVDLNRLAHRDPAATTDGLAGLPRRLRRDAARVPRPDPVRSGLRRRRTGGRRRRARGVRALHDHLLRRRADPRAAALRGRRSARDRRPHLLRARACGS